MKVATVYRHLQAIQFVFRLAADYKAVPHDLMRKVLWTTKQLKKLKAEEKDMSRLAWGDKLPDLLATTAFVSPQGGAPHAVFWPTLISAHAGLRMEEVLQLKTADFDKIDGIPVIRVQNGEGQHLKSEAAERIIPIHRNLIELGLLQMVEERRASGQEWLFPNIERCAAKARLSGTFTKVFTNYRITEGVYDPRRDFHSLRTNFNVILKRKKCPLEIRKRLLGHELNDVTEDHYDPEGSPIAEFDEWVQSIDIDISGITSPYRKERAVVGNVVSFATSGAA
ncbi:site-specific integrase [Paracoccus zeaxanthinifaciens]|uniref:site-specific integrase n=1 Tax=Paracoccus zeaxanthinifaciens TaxID=187400 RepID=UPI0003B3241E|nr:site-specific integrase [Paracoccus zeaxanthinifaciens]